VLEQENPPANEIESLLDVVKRNLLLLKVTSDLPSGVDEVEYRKMFSDLELQLGQVNNVTRIDSPEQVRQVKSTIQSVLDSLAIYRLSSLTQARKIEESTTLYLAERLLINGLFYPLGLSMFSLLAFYIAYAAYRSFRVRSIEAAVMMVSAFVVLLGQVPQGVMYISEDLPYYRLWIMEYLSTPAFRAIYFSSAIAGLSLAVRMWLSLDKNPFSSK